jgi:autotransporter-associated beta strand protein
LLPFPIQAQLVWGTNGSGGSGTWDSTTADWYNGTSSVSWSSGDSATFSGTGGTVTVSGSQTASQLTFNAAGYSLTGGFINGTSSGLTVQANSDALISGPVFGGSPYTGTFTKSGFGTLTLDNSFAFFGQADITQGTLNAGSFASTSSTTVYDLSNATGVDLTFSAGTNVTYFLGGLAGGGASGGNVTASSSDGTTTLLLFNSGSSSFAGALQDSGTGTLALTMSGSGTQTLDSAENYRGATTVSAGTLILSGSGSLSNSAVTVAGGTLELDDTGTMPGNRISSTAPFTMSGGTLLYQGNTSAPSAETLQILSLTGGASTVTVNAGLGQTANLTFQGLSRSTGGGTINFGGTGTTQITGAANLNGILGGYATYGGTEWAAVNGSSQIAAYSGYVTNINTAFFNQNVKLSGSGTTTLSAAGAINSLNLQNSSGSAEILDLGGNSLNLTSGGILSSGSNSTTIQDGFLTSSGHEIIVTDAGTQTISANLVDSSGSTALTKSGAGILNLGGNNTYSGATSIDQGTLEVQSTTGLSASSPLNIGTGTLNLNNFNSTVGGLSGGGTVTLGSGTLTINGAGTSSYYGAIGGTGGLVKTGTGSLTLVGQNSYTGPTQVTGGTLTLQEGTQGPDPTLASSSNITLGNATLAISTFGGVSAQSLGTLNLQGNAVLNLNNPFNFTLSFANSSTQNWGTNRLTIENFNPTLDTLQFGSTSGGLTNAQLSDITFQGAPGDIAELTSNGDIVMMAAPEPSSVTLLLVALAAMALALPFRARTRRT